MSPRVFLFFLLSFVFLNLTSAGAVRAEEGPPMPAAVELEGKALRLAIKGLDRSDPAVRYALGLRREGYLFIGGGATAMLGVIAAGSAVSRLGNDEGQSGRLVISVGMPIAIGVLVGGVPGLLAGQRYLAWYARNPEAPNDLARLKLMNQWRRQYLQVKKNTGLLGSAFVGAATLLAGAGWASNDRAGFNGEVGTDTYNPGDALATLSFGMVTAGLAISGLVSHQLLEKDAIDSHPALADLRLDFGFSPERNESEVEGYRVQGRLSFNF